MDWKQSFIDGTARAVASIVCLPITYMMLKLFVWTGMLEWASLPTPDNRQIMVAAFFIAVFAR
jgi:hypothetical protein